MPDSNPPTVLEQRQLQIAETRMRLAACPDCRPKSLALTNLENAEIMLDHDYYDEPMRADMAYDYLILAWGWERRISA